MGLAGHGLSTNPWLTCYNNSVIIYALYNKVTGKIYVGKTEKDLAARWKSHVHSAKYNGTCRLLYASIRKHGAESFEVFELTCGFTTRTELDAAERLWIAVLDATNTSVGYNLTAGGQGGVQTAAVRRQIGISGKGKAGGWNRGKKFGPYKDGRNKKISATLQGRTLSAAHKEAIGRGVKGKVPWNKGKKLKPMTPQQCANVSAGIKAKYASGTHGRWLRNTPV